MAKEILTSAQRRVLELFAESPGLVEKYYLTGGTVLAAFYLGHRLSDDLDFFTSEPVDFLSVEQFMRSVKDTLGAHDLGYSRVADRLIFGLELTDANLKVEFTRYPYPSLAKQTVQAGVRVDSLTDLAANKLMALYDRFEPKDYVDCYFLLKQFSLDELRRLVKQKFGFRLEALALGSALARSRRLVDPSLPWPQLIRPLERQTVVDFFSELARKLGQSILE